METPARSAAEIKNPRTIVPREIEKSFKCIVCNNFNMEKMSFLLPCLHHVCTDEVEELFSTRESSGVGTGSCRACNLKFDTSELVPVKVKEQHDQLKLSETNITCTLCTREPKLPTVKFCSTCFEFLCNPCMDGHCYMKHTSDHVLLSVMEGQRIMRDKAKIEEKKVEKCTQHENELSLFCATCDSLICTDCVPPEHNGHDIQEAAALIKELRDMLHEGLTEFKPYPQYLRETAVLLSDKSQSILDFQKNKLIAQLRRQLNEAMTALLGREQEIRGDIVRKTLMKKTELNMKLRIATSVKGQVEQYLHSIPQYLEFSDADLFAKRKLLTKQYRSLQFKTSQYKALEHRKLYAEAGWFFRVHSDEDFHDTQQEFMNRLGRIMYTNGTDVQNELGALVGPSTEPPSRGPLQEILLGNRKNKLPDIQDEGVAPDSDKVPGTGGSVTADSVSHIATEGSSADVEDLRGMGSGNALDEIQLESTAISQLETNEADSQVSPEIDQSMDATVSDREINTGRNKAVKKTKAKRSFKSVEVPPADQNQSEELPTNGTKNVKTKSKSTSDSTSASTASPPKLVNPLADAIAANSPSPVARENRNNRGRPPRSLANYSLSLSSKETTTDEDAPGSSAVARSSPKRRKKSSPKTGTVEENTGRRGRSKARSSGPRDERSTLSELSGDEAKTDKMPESASPAVKQRKKPGPAPGFKRKKLEPDLLTELLAFPLTLTAMRLVEDDPNEDYCSVCLDGGGCIVCCDYCPKVFHVDCHMPNIADSPKEETEWQCFYCLKKDDLEKLPEELLKQIVFPKGREIPNEEFLHACKFLVELFKCEGSEFVGVKYACHFKRVNKYDPEDINSLRIRLTDKTPEQPPFVSIEEFLLAIRRMVYQANAFYDTIEKEGIQETWSRFKTGYKDVLALYYPSEPSDYVPDSTDRPIKHYK